MNGDSSGAKQKWFNRSFLLLLLLLGGTLAVLCHQAFGAYQVHWANDQPLGALMESSARFPSAFWGFWSDFYWLGGPNVGNAPDLTNICMTIFGPEHQLKFYVPGCSFFLGFGAWFFFRQLRFNPMACVLAGLGAGLNMHFFSNATWGLGTWSVCTGLIFIAMGILVSPNIEKLWIKGVLAGLCTGLAVMEGIDVGAILSVYLAVFLVFRFFCTEPSLAKCAGKTTYVGGILVASAVLISISTLGNLIGTQLQGTTGPGQTDAEKRAAWDKNTQWSVPKLETLRLLVPGLFGYRLDVYSTSPDPAGYYWGTVAEDPRIGELTGNDPVERSNAAVSLSLPEQIQTIMEGHDKELKASALDWIIGNRGLQRRHTGNGEYTGMLVCLLALFGLVNALRKTDSPYSVIERRMVRFWGGAALFSLLVAWGRHGFLYTLIYHLPLVANFRNPMKYLHPLNVSLIILCGFGLEVLCRRYLAATSKKAEPIFAWMGTCWKRVSAFEKWWMAGCALALLGAVAAYLILDSAKADLVKNVLHSGFDASVAPKIARFCIGEVGWFVVFLALSVGVLAGILGGAFTGRRAVWAFVFLGAIMICDLSRADAPWIRYYNYKKKMSMNPIVDIVRHEPWEHRINARVWPAGGYLSPELTQLCHWWLENDYPINDVQCLEIDQAPRMAVLENNYLGQFYVTSDHDLWRATRLWELTNTRYIVAGAGWEQGLNQLGEPKNSFRTVLRMNVVNKPGVVQPEDQGDVTVQTNSNGTVALLEFTAALPRAKLYSNWKTVDDNTALQLLGSPAFDPQKTVLVAKDTPVPQAPVNPEADPGTVKITHYQSKDLTLEADAKTPAVLLLNDRTGDSWYVWIDGKPGTVLRCNYIVRGVFVPAGHHTIEFRYQPPLHLLYISLTTFALGLVLAGFVIVTQIRRKPETPPASAPKRPGKP